MKIIVGLGNPGPQYELTRHNVGFLAVDRLIDRWRAEGPTKKYQSEIYQASFQNEKILLMKPQTFMNLSGKAVGPAFTFYQCKPEDLIVIHDELDLDPMVLRLKSGGGAGGHNGLKSIDENIGKDRTGYYRIRIGIGHPSRLVANDNLTSAKISQVRKMSPADYVLQPYSDHEIKELDEVLDQVAEATEMLLQGQFQTAMNKFHRSQSKAK